MEAEAHFFLQSISSKHHPFPKRSEFIPIDQPFTMAKFVASLQDGYPKRAPGPDGIPHIPLHHPSDEYKRYLLHYINYT